MKTLLLALLAAAAVPAAPPDPVAWKLEGAPEKPLKPGARFTLRLVAKIQDGWHLYSLKPMAEGPIPTRIWLAEGQPFALAAAVRGPAPRVVDDPAFGMEVELYEGEATFTLPLRIGEASGGVQKLLVNASYQSCNNKICLPPKTVRVEAAVSVAK